MSDQVGDNQQEEKMESNGTALSTKVTDEGFWRDILRQIRLVWHLLRSPDVPLYLKILPAIAVVYVLLPTDLIPDVFPVLGQLDDITALLLGAKVFIELAPQEVVARYIHGLRQQGASSQGASKENGPTQSGVEDQIVIDGEYHIIEDQENDRAE